MTSPLNFPCRVGNNEGSNESCSNTIFWDEENQSWSPDINASNVPTYGVNVSRLMPVFWDRVDIALRHYTDPSIKCGDIILSTKEEIQAYLKQDCEYCNILVAQLLSLTTNKDNHVLFKALTHKGVQLATAHNSKEKENSLSIFEAEEGYFNIPEKLNTEQAEKQTFIGKILLTTRAYYHPEAPTPEQAKATNLEVYFDIWEGTNKNQRLHDDMVKDSGLHKGLNRYSEDNLGGSLVNIIVKDSDSVKIELTELSGDFGEIQCRTKIDSHLITFLRHKFKLLGFKNIEICMRNLK